MSPGRRPNPRRESHGVASVMTITPTTRTRSHFSTARSLARIAPALEDDADLAHLGDVPQLGHGHLHPRRLEFAGDHRAHVLGERFEQAKLALRKLLRDAFDDFAVVHGVVDVVGL